MQNSEKALTYKRKYSTIILYMRLRTTAGANLFYATEYSGRKNAVKEKKYGKRNTKARVQGV